MEVRKLLKVKQGMLILMKVTEIYLMPKDKMIAVAMIVTREEKILATTKKKIRKKLMMEMVKRRKVRKGRQGSTTLTYKHTIILYFYTILRRCL